MKFGPVDLAQVEGAILAHSVRLNGKTLRKGRVLSATDIEGLRDANYKEVVVARLEAGDVAEDEAAAALAHAVCGEGVDLRAPFTGRCNVFAERDGLLVVERERLDALNRVDEALTVATLPPYVAVNARQMLATIKIIPFAAPRHSVDACVEIAAPGGPLIHVAPFREMTCGLIQTRLPGLKESILDKTTRVLGERLERLGSHLLDEIRCPHETSAVADAISTTLQAGAELVLIAGASAIVDRRDVLPAGIELAGGHVEHFGMPVDPGNLLMLARCGEIPVIGLPGCARSPKFNGFDQVLERLAAGLSVAPADVMGMGVGGLLKEIAERPQPRSEGLPASRASGQAPRIAALLLAAGQSRRMGEINKLLAEVDGVPMVVRVADAVASSSAEALVVVTGHEHERVEAALSGRGARFVHNPDYPAGLSTSLRRGLAALPDVDGVLVCLGDMPRLRGQHFDRLIAAFDPVEGREICVPTHTGKRGNPVLWGKRFFAEMEEVKGDVGARHLIGEYESLVCEVAIDDPAVLVDVDSPQALSDINAARGG